jgi:hypothetical protein
MIRAFQWDLARQVERLDWLLRQLPRYADWGYTELYLHLEDAVEYPSLPGIARADAYSHHQLGRLVDAAHRVGIKVVPIVNLLGHTQYLIKVPELRDLNELRAADGSPREIGQICPVHPRTLEVAEKLLRDMAPFCTAGKVHVGLDESFHLGKHPLSQREIREIGLPAHFARYVGRLNGLARSLGLRTGIWADMLYFLPEAVDLLPTDVAAYEWYYYGFERRPRVEVFNFAGSNLGERLRRRGIEYWGCPMNGAFRFEPLPPFSDRLDNILSWERRCRKLDATGMLITSWEPNRLAMELTTVIDAAAASLWLDGIAKPRRMLERGFARVFGPATAKTAARTALACDRFPFSGYPRWEINTRWDVISRRESMSAYRGEARHFHRLAFAKRRGNKAGLPKPLQASLELRWYLAARDVFVRLAQKTSSNARKTKRQLAADFGAALRIGQRAQRTMWRTTRDAHDVGPNEAILAADAARFAAWKRGEPVFGPGWQLCYRVNNVAPAAQQVAVQQQQKDGAWRDLQACYTIEFQKRSARPRRGLIREHAAPIDWNGDATTLPELRFVLRGLGCVRIEAAVLTDGHAAIRCSPPQFILGKPAPRSGFYEFSGGRDNATAPVRLRIRKPRTTR